MNTLRVTLIAAIVLAAGAAHAQRNAQTPTPPITGCSPMALAPGKTTRVTFYGGGVGKPLSLWTSIAAKAVLVPSDAAPAAFDITPAGDAAPGIVAVRVIGTRGVSNPLLLMIDGLPAIQQDAANRSRDTARKLDLPAAVEGTCDELGHDYYRFTGRADQFVSIDVAAGRLGSRLDAVLRVLDADGRELLHCDDDPAAAADPRGSLQLPADGDYFIELRDVNYEGGPQHRYRLRVGEFRIDHPRPAQGDLVEIEPNDAHPQPLTLPTTRPVSGRFDTRGDRDCYRFTASKGDRFEFRAQTRVIGSPCDAVLRILAADGAVLAASKSSDPGDALVTHKFDADGTYCLTVEELSNTGGEHRAYRLTAGPASPGFSLALDTDRAAARPGGEFTLKVTPTRRAYSGEIVLAVECDGAAFEVTNAVIKGSATEVQLKVKVPPSMTPGQLLHLKVTGKAKSDPSGPAVTASTLPALRTLFPRLLYPPAELDGVVAFCVTSP